MSGIAPDTIIDSRYKVLSRIGAGGMAEVFCAHDQSLGRKVALKLLHPRFATDPEFVERFRREASSAAGLQHPNVVSIYDRGQWDGTYYIAMEYLPGRTLKDVVRQDGPLDPLRAIDLTEQVLRAARFAHRRGIVHRDLKPHNVMVDDEDRAKVTDFGIARAGASDMTETGSIMGTAQYLSPEQAQGHAVDERSDLYSVGIILFELLTGRVPFEAESAVTIALRHVSEPAPAPSSLSPAVPPELDAIVLWALEKDPARRPQDAEAFIAALEDARAHLRAGAPAGQPTAMFAPVVVGAPPLADEEPAEAEPAPVEPQPRRRPPWWVWVLAVLALAGVAAAAILLTRAEQVRVPGVVGERIEVASRRLEARGFEVATSYETADAPAGEVVGQRPGARARVDEGSVVNLRVSNGPGTVDVPAVVGDTVADARRKLDRADLAAEVVERYDADVAAGLVIDSSPAAGQDVRPGDTVKLFVSRGVQPVAVPEVVGWSQSDAEAELSNAGLDVAVTEQESADADPGTVIAQDPEGGGSAAPGSTVSLVVATAPPVEVPGVVGQTEDEARAALSAEGLEPRVSRQPVTDPAQDGLVLSQRPEPGTSAEAGAPVRIVVGRLEQEPVPPEDDATTPDGADPDDAALPQGEAGRASPGASRGNGWGRGGRWG